MYCKKCGGKVDNYASNCPFCGEPTGASNLEATYKGNGATGVQENKSVGSWILTYIIISIPIVNIIMMFIWALGKKSNSNTTFKNWAKMNLIFWLIGIILIGVVVVLELTVLNGFLSNRLNLPI